LSPDPSNQPTDAAAQPVGEGDYVVGDAECLNSIAKNTGYFWQTLWNHPKNATLKKTRKDHNILMPGDRVHIPERELKEVGAATDKRHVFHRKGVPSKMRIRLLDHDSPETYKNKPYTVTIDGAASQGTVDEDGYVDLLINPGARGGQLAVGEPGDQELFDFVIAGVDPIESPRGAQQRLYNLGFFMVGTPENEWTDEAVEALKRFQAAYVLTNDDKLPNGMYDQETQNKLKKVHGC